MKGQKALEKIVVFISVNTSAASSTNRQELKPSKAITRTPGVRMNNFELLMLNHDRAYITCEFKRKYVCDNKM